MSGALIIGALMGVTSVAIRLSDACAQGNAVKDFCSRIRENSDICHETLPKSHDFGYEKRLFSSTKNP